MSKNYTELVPGAENATDTARLNRLATFASNEFIRMHPGLSSEQLYEGLFNTWQKMADSSLDSSQRDSFILEKSGKYIREEEVNESQGFLHVPSFVLPEIAPKLFNLIDTVITPEGNLHPSIDTREKFLSFLGNVESLLTILHLPKDGCGRIGEDFMRAIVERQKNYHVSPLSSNGYRLDSRVTKKVQLERIYKEKFASVISRSNPELKYGIENYLPMREAMLSYFNTSESFTELKNLNGGEFTDPLLPYAQLSKIIFGVFFDRIAENPANPLFPTFDQGWRDLYKFDSEYVEVNALPEDSVANLEQLVGWVKYWLPLLNHKSINDPQYAVIRGNDLLIKTLSDPNLPSEVVVDFGAFWLSGLNATDMSQHDPRSADIAKVVVKQMRVAVETGLAHDRERLADWKLMLQKNLLS
jgi:hypothetical protein